MALREHLVLCAAILSIGCSKRARLPLPAEDGKTPHGPCNTIFFRPDQVAGAHVEECSFIPYHTDPPSSGNHYAIWADYKPYDVAIAPGYWVHSIEHGGIALLYGCDKAKDGACAQMVGSIASYVSTLTQDDKCPLPLRTRTLVLPYPSLGVAFAAVAWGHYLRAECFDAELVSTFIDNFYGQSYEDTCVAGFDPSSKPATCGKP
jgi:hypothetical protein